MQPAITAIVLNWCEMHIVAQTLANLLNDKLSFGALEVIVVDNGSHDGSQDYLNFMNKRQHEHGGRLKHVLLSNNTGPSIARNAAIAMTRGEDIFFIDGDICYVAGTIEMYVKIKRHYADQGVKIGCVGQNNHWRVQETGMNGTRDPGQAHQQMPTDFSVSKWFPMAWTQYGLFDGTLLRAFRFHADGVYGEPGHGYEDDWLFHELKAVGAESLAVDAPLYYHDGHYGLNLLQATNVPDKGKERAEAFYKRWGTDSGWRESMNRIPATDMVPFEHWRNAQPSRPR